MRVSPSYLIGDGGFLLGPTAIITAVRDLDVISLHIWQQELPVVGLLRSEITIDGKNFDNDRCHDPCTRISNNTVIKSLFEKCLGYEKRESSSPVRTVGAPTPTTRSTFGSHLRARRVGEAELNNALYPNHVMKCIHTVHRHKRCYECCCYSCCQAMQCHSRTQIHWRE